MINKDINTPDDFRGVDREFLGVKEVILEKLNISKDFSGKMEHVSTTALSQGRSLIKGDKYSQYRAVVIQAINVIALPKAPACQCILLS